MTRINRRARETRKQVNNNNRNRRTICPNKLNTYQPLYFDPAAAPRAAPPLPRPAPAPAPPRNPPRPSPLGGPVRGRGGPRSLLSFLVSTVILGTSRGKPPAG